MKLTNFLHNIMNKIKNVLYYPVMMFHIIFLESPYERLQREHYERINKIYQDAEQRINAAYKEVPELKTNRDPSFLLNIIKNHNYSDAVREESYSLILGITPPGQSKRYPLSLTSEQLQALVKLICNESDNSANIKFDTFVNQDELIFIYENATVSEIRARALSRLMKVERNLLLLLNDIVNMHVILPKKIQITVEDRKIILDKMIRRDGQIIIFDLSSSEMPDILVIYLKNRDVSDLRGLIWKCSTQKELREYLISAQKEEYYSNITLLREKMDLEKCQIDSLLIQAKHEDKKLGDMLNETSKLIAENRKNENIRISINKINEQTVKEMFLLAQIENLTDDYEEIIKKIENLIEEKNKKNSFPHYDQLLNNPWTLTNYDIVDRIRYHEPDDFLFSLFQDSLVNDHNSEIFHRKLVSRQTNSIDAKNHSLTE